MALMPRPTPAAPSAAVRARLVTAASVLTATLALAALARHRQPQAWTVTVPSSTKPGIRPELLRDFEAKKAAFAEHARSRRAWEKRTPIHNSNLMKYNELFNEFKAATEARRTELEPNLDLQKSALQLEGDSIRTYRAGFNAKQDALRGAAKLLRSSFEAEFSLGRYGDDAGMNDLPQLLSSVFPDEAGRTAAFPGPGPARGQMPTPLQKGLARHLAGCATVGPPYPLTLRTCRLGAWVLDSRS